MRSATCGKPSVRRRCDAAVGEKRASGSSPSTRSSLEVAGAAPGRATTAPCSAERTSSQPMCGCVAQRRQQRGMTLPDLLQRHPAADSIR